MDTHNQMLKQATITWSQFIQEVLYATEIGYYASKRLRVGKSENADFYTASSVGPLFGRLLIDAACNLLGTKNPKEYTFVEIAVEAGNSVLKDLKHPFKNVLELPLGTNLKIPSKAIVFANEWLDALPFERVVRGKDGWLMRHVVIDGKNLSETTRPLDSDLPWINKLPENAPEGYEIDIPYETSTALQKIAEQPWEGVFYTFDYGLEWFDHCNARASGTARGYRKHELVTNLLEKLGETDITCHVVWDWLKKVLSNNQFSSIDVQRQESFFMHHSQKEIARVIENKPGSFIDDRAKLMELLHPNHMGAQFQVLFGIRLSQ